MWREMTDSELTLAKGSASSSFKTAELKMLHAFVNGTVFGHLGSHSSVSREDIWVMDRALSGLSINTAQLIVENMRSAAENPKFVLPYANFLTGYFREKGLWNQRYEDSMRTHSRATLASPQFFQNSFTLRGTSWIKKAQAEKKKGGVQGKEEGTSAAQEVPDSSNQNSMLEILRRVEINIMELREEVTRKLDVQAEKLDALNQRLDEFQTHEKVHESDEERTSPVAPSSTPTHISLKDQHGEASSRQPVRQTLEDLSEAASAFDTQQNPTPSSRQHSPKPPADMLFMFPSK